MASPRLLAMVTAALVGLLFAATIGIDAIAIAWTVPSLLGLPAIVGRVAGVVVALMLAVPTFHLVRAVWRVELAAGGPEAISAGK